MTWYSLIILIIHSYVLIPVKIKMIDQKETIYNYYLILIAVFLMGTGFIFNSLYILLGDVLDI